MITNRHRINYVLDMLAESFPDKAKLKSCACGEKSNDDKSKMLTKRDLIEQSFLDAWNMDHSEETPVSDLEILLDRLSEQKIKSLLSKVNVTLIDTHLQDLAIFMDPMRPVQTTLSEIKKWDKRHAQDYEQM